MKNVALRDVENAFSRKKMPDCRRGVDLAAFYVHL